MDELLVDLCKKYSSDSPELRNEIETLKRKLDGSSEWQTHSKGVNKISNSLTVKKTKYECLNCFKVYSNQSNLNRHYKKCCYKCKHCDEVLKNYTDLFEHVNTHHPLGNIQSQTGSGNVQKRHIRNTKDTAALDAIANRHTIYPLNTEEKYDLLTFFTNIRDDVVKHLQDRRKKLNHIKYHVSVQVQMSRQKDNGTTETTEPHFRSKTDYLLTDEDVHERHHLNVAFQKMFKSFDEFIRRGSSWTLKRILHIDLSTGQYKPIGGKAFFPLPQSLSKTGAVLNIQNKDDKCFLYSILASMYPQSQNPHRVNHYLHHEKELDMRGIELPVTPQSLSKFETQNNISVNAIGYQDGDLFPMYMSKLKGEKIRHEVDLLYITNGEKKHWCLIKNLNRLLYRVKSKGRSYQFCRRCFQGFTSKKVLHQHSEYCNKHDIQHTTLPTVGKDDILKFNQYGKKLTVPFICYADFETFSTSMKTCYPNPNESSTTTNASLEPCGFGYKVVCTVGNQYTKETKIYRGPDVSKKFLECLIQEEQEIQNILENKKPLEMTLDDEIKFNQAVKCHICDCVFDKSKIRVRDHCHVSGRFRGAACKDCNLNYKHPKFIPIVFHNLRGFDSHIIMQSIGMFKQENIKLIASSEERYVSFSLGRLRFIDSYQFLSCSLEELTNSLAADGRVNNFNHFKSEFLDDGIVSLLLRKNVYPYEFVEDSSKFQMTSLPEKEAFYSSLTKEHISESDYNHAKKVFQVMGLQNLGEYHDLYLKTDVLLLADIFENFRMMCLKFYQLDPAWFYGAPGLAWQSALKMAGVELELLTDSNIWLFF